MDVLKDLAKGDGVMKWVFSVLFLIIGYLVANEHRMTIVEGMTSAHDRAISALYNKIDNIDNDIKALIAKH